MVVAHMLMLMVMVVCRRCGLLMVMVVVVCCSLAALALLLFLFLLYLPMMMLLRLVDSHLYLLLPLLLLLLLLLLKHVENGVQVSVLQVRFEVQVWLRRALQIVLLHRFLPTPQVIPSLIRCHCCIYLNKLFLISQRE